MARPLRIEFPDAIYHVTARGIERAAIVADDRDRDAWLRRLERTAQRYHWRVFAFVLLDNHFHLFFQTPEPNLSVGMQDLSGGHAGYFNARHRRSGHLFQGRFKAVLIEAEGHWLEVSRYVHLNPVRAGLAAKPEPWKWSSYPGYCRQSGRLDWMDYGPVLAEFGGDNRAGIRAYRAFVEQGLRERLASPFSQAFHGVILGSQAFVEQVRARLNARDADPEVPLLDRVRNVPRPGTEQVILAVGEHFGCDPAQWRSGRRCDELARAAAAYLLRQLTAQRAGTIAQSLGYRGSSSVSMACRRIEKAMETPDFAELIGQLAEKLTTDMLTPEGR